MPFNAILIDPHKREISQVPALEDGQIERIRSLVRFENEGIDFGMLPTGDQYCVDEYGYERPGQRFFRIEGHRYVVPGKALIFGVGPEGESVDSSITVAGWWKLVTWCPEGMRFLGYSKSVGEVVHPLFGKMTRTVVEPVFEGEDG